MKKTLICASMIFVLSLLTVIVVAQTRRTYEEEYVRRVIDIEEGASVHAVVKVCDPDGDAITIEVPDLPEGATLSATYVLPPELIPDPNNPEDCPDPNQCEECLVESVSWYAADIDWTPNYAQAGEHRLHLHALDDKGGDDWVVFIINVADKNRPPQL